MRHFSCDLCGKDLTPGKTVEEILKEESQPELERLATLSEANLKDLAGKFLTALEEIVQERSDLKATRLIGPLVYAAYRSRDRAVQTSFESFLIRNPNPAYLRTRTTPLIERNPLLFWKLTTVILACTVIALLAFLHAR